MAQYRADHFGKHTCGNCSFFVELKSPHLTAPGGHCRRYPPRLFQETNMVSGYQQVVGEDPFVGAASYCGEHPEIREGCGCTMRSLANAERAQLAGVQDGSDNSGGG